MNEPPKPTTQQEPKLMGRPVMFLKKLWFGIQALYDNRRALQIHLGSSYLLGFISESSAITKGEGSYFYSL